MSGGVPAGERREEIAQIVARAYGGSLYPGLGVPGDYPTADVDYRAADAILALPTPTPPIEGRDADVVRVELVARAICTQQIPVNLHRFNRRGYVERHWHLYEDHARAALQALGERG
jgi:hypothetical protein